MKYILNIIIKFCGFMILFTMLTRYDLPLSEWISTLIAGILLSISGFIEGSD